MSERSANDLQWVLQDLPAHMYDWSTVKFYTSTGPERAKQNDV